MGPAVSILIPCHNAAAYIAQAIESALAQGGDGVEVEVIVVDDGSTDGSADIIRGFDGRIVREEGVFGGAPAARNRLLALASAPWVQYLDADDYLRPGKVAGQLAALRERPEVDVLYGPGTIEWCSASATRTEERAIPAPHDPYAELALWLLPQTGAPLWRRQALLDVGGWTVGQPCCQEHELYLRLLMAGKAFAYHPSGGSVYRRFEDGTLSTREPALVRSERLKIEQRLEEHLAATGSLTAQRQWAINQARFDMARSAWVVDREEARGIFATITDRRGFRPRGITAPPAYRAIYTALGFEAAEQVAAARRALRSGRRATNVEPAS